MTQPVDVPLLGTFSTYLYLLLYGALCTIVGLVAAGVVTFLLVRVLRRRGVAGRWRIALTSGLAVYLAATIFMWLSWASYAWIRVTPQGIELRYATWPRPGRMIAFEHIESVSQIHSRGRKGGVTHHLEIVTKTESPFGWRMWRSEAADGEHVKLALQWIEHAGGGRVVSRR